MSRLRLIFTCAIALSAAVALGSATPARAQSVSFPPALGGFDTKACLPQLPNTGVVAAEGLYVNSYIANGQPSNMTMGSLPDNYYCLVGFPNHFSNVTFTVEVKEFIPGSPPTLGATITTYTVSIQSLMAKFIVEGPSSGDVGVPFKTTTPIYTDPGSDLGWTSKVVSGSLPPGLSLSGNGVISGTPTQEGTYDFTLEYTTDAIPWNTSSRPRSSFRLTIARPVVLELTPSVTPTATAYAPYSQALTTGGGTAPYTYVITEGTLPPGLTLAPTGALSGVPTKAGTYQFTIKATDSLGFTTSRPYTVTIGWPALTFDPLRLKAGTQNKVYYGRVRAFGGRGPYTYSLKAGSKRLPRGLTLAPNGVITGKPKVFGTFTFTVAVVDVNGAPGERTYTLKIAKAKKVVKKKTTARTR
jgi:Putative Ig domain